MGGRKKIPDGVETIPRVGAQLATRKEFVRVTDGLFGFDLTVEGIEP